MARARIAPQVEVPGLAARRIATDIVDGVLRRRIALDDQLSGKSAHLGLATLADRDRALMRRLAATVLRRLGTLRHLVGGFLDKGFPADAPRTEIILLVGAAQILWLDVPDHAAVDLSVRLAQADRRAARYAGLVNAVLRRVAQARATFDAADVTRDTPEWLLKRWRKTYGDDTAQAIAAANGHEPALDLTVKQDAANWAERLHGEVLPTGTVRTSAQGAISLLPGFVEGAWWVQDAAASIPAHLFGAIAGKDVCDLCAAPGGKSAQLAIAGANVIAVDRSPARIARLKENFARLKLNVETVAADALEWQPDRRFDAVLLDAPCTATGTIRRHPDVPWLKSENDLGILTALQSRLLDRAANLLKPGGTLVYCTCSLEPEEGEAQIADLLARDPRLTRAPITAAEVFGHAEFVTRKGELRTLPHYLPHADPRWSGLDGFFAARLTRKPD
ncbi:RsmB/NOP family class I SAM-dependent RNA methyltransferase [Undibacter mobilis]|uniref:Methyltransferase domain-containing protein n=1 Tax=Undibacter mobilis TaxID=2292256 RepID=A0A371B8R5_9BRAD|nr:transcription antitermination factor NusB [Undibacter mobilis]RDV03986.1 methyltransferase domain-containing protein [Undibacter mobilis]